MDDDLIQKSPAAALESLRDCHFGSRGGSSDGSAPFLVPVGEEKSDSQGGALARYYDLARHLSEDFQAGGNAVKKDAAPKNAPAKETPTTSSCPSAAENPAPTPSSPLFHSSRQLFSQIAGKGAENVSATGAIAAPSGRENASIPAGLSLHDAARKEVMEIPTCIGTIHALNGGDMTAKNENAPIRILSTTSGLFGSIRFTGGTGSENSFSGNKDSDPRRDERTSTAGAMSVASGEGSGVVVTPGKLATGPMQEISETLLVAMENMKREGDASATIPVALSDGSTLELRLRWKGGRVTASFGSGAEEFRGEIENGWGSLSRRAGSLGMTLEPPSFDGSEKGAIPSFYA